MRIRTIIWIVIHVGKNKTEVRTYQSRILCAVTDPFGSKAGAGLSNIPFKISCVLMVMVDDPEKAREEQT